MSVIPVEIFADELKLHQQWGRREEGNNESCGSIFFNSTEYAVFVDTLNNFIAVYKTTDGWATKSECDSGNHKNCAPNYNHGGPSWSPSDHGFGYETYSSDIHPTNGELYIAYLNTSRQLNIATFDMNTETWVSEITSLIDFSWLTGTSLGAPYFMMNYRAIDNKFVVLFEDLVNPLPEIYICSITKAGVVSTPQLVSTAIANTSRSIITFDGTTFSGTYVFIQSFTGASFESVSLFVFTSSDVLSSETSIYDTGNDDDNVGLSRPQYVSSTDEVVISFHVNTHPLPPPPTPHQVRIHILRSAATAAPVFSVQTVADSNTEKAQSQAIEAKTSEVRFFFDFTPTGTDFITGRASPYFDMNTATWAAKFSAVVGRLYVLWRFLGIGPPFTDPGTGESGTVPESIWYSEYVGGIWQPMVELVTHLSFNPLNDGARIVYIDAEIRPEGAVPAVSYFVPPQYHKVPWT